MQVSFNGLYRITGVPANSNGRRRTIRDLSEIDIKSFLEDTKKFRNGKGSIYYDGMTQDLFIPVNDNKELEFEDQVDLYNIDCVKIGDRIARNSATSNKIAEALKNYRVRDRFGLS